MRQRFVTSQWIPYTVDLAFAFFANPNNLPLLMPEPMKMRIDELSLVPAPPNPMIAAAQLARQEIAAGAGTEMKISFRPLGYVPMRVSWVARITEFAWYSHFCDEQVRGPFEFFRHRHRMRPEAQQGRVGTELTDEVEFSLPLGSVGHLLDGVVQRQMKQMFKMRQERLPAILEAKVRQAS
jgi:ligand-binding SRPBCC domain-containing protein